MAKFIESGQVMSFAQDVRAILIYFCQFLKKPYLPQMPPIEILMTYKNCAYCSATGCEPDQKDFSGLPVPCKSCGGAGVVVLHKDSPPCRFCSQTGRQN